MTAFDQVDQTPALAAALGVTEDQLSELFECGLFEVIEDEAQFAASLDGIPCTFAHLLEAARVLLAADLADIEDELFD